jgi:hypothetical protein
MKIDAKGTRAGRNPSCSTVLDLSSASRIGKGVRRQYMAVVPTRPARITFNFFFYNPSSSKAYI